MAGKIEIRASGEKYRYVVLNRSGDKLLQSAQFDDKAAAKRAATSLAKAVSDAEIVDASKPAPAAAKVAKPAAVAAKAVKPVAAAAKSSARRPSAKR